MRMVACIFLQILVRYYISSISELVDGELAHAAGDGHGVTQYRPTHTFDCRRQRWQQVSKIDGRRPLENPELSSILNFHALFRFYI